MIIDIHTHAFPDALAARAVPVLAAEAGIPAHTDGTCDDLRASMQRAGIDCSVIMNIATKPSQTRAINAWAAHVNRRYADLICFGTLHPAQEDWAAEVERLVADGVRGVKLHPDYQLFFVDDPAMLPCFRLLAQAGLILLLHAGVDIGLPPPVHCPPDRLARVLDAVPELTIIAAHMGGYTLWDDVERYLLGRALYLDTSYTHDDLGRDRLRALIEAHGVPRVLFGTDSPWKAQAAEVASMRDLGLPSEDLHAVFGENARRLLRLAG